MVAIPKPISGTFNASITPQRNGVYGLTIEIIEGIARRFALVVTVYTLSDMDYCSGKNVTVVRNRDGTEFYGRTNHQGEAKLHIPGLSQETLSGYTVYI